jgi:glutathione S-transferase
MYKLHAFAQSGNCYKVALLLQALGVEWETLHMPFSDFASGVPRSEGWRQSQNAMGEIPVLEVDGRKLTQSGAILIHLANKHGAYGGEDEDQRQEVLRWILFDNHKFTSYFASWRFTKSFSPVAPDPGVEKWLKGRIDNAFGIVERHLADREYIVGNAPTIADMSLSGRPPRDRWSARAGSPCPAAPRPRGRRRDRRGSRGSSARSRSRRAGSPHCPT